MTTIRSLLDPFDELEVKSASRKGTITLGQRTKPAVPPEPPKLRPLLVPLRGHGLVFLEQHDASPARPVMQLLLALEKGKPRGLRGIAGEWEFTP